MATLKFTNLPERGDIVLVVKSTGDVVFLKESSITNVNDIDTTEYDIVGVVFKRDGNTVKFINNQNASKTWCERYVLKLTGYTLDGEEHSGVLTVRDSSNWAVGVDYTITYTASTIGELVNQLNEYFAENTPFTTQDWIAEVVDNDINLSYSFVDYCQANNTAKNGFSVAGNLLPEIPILAKILRKNGYSGGEGAISSMTKAVQYFSSDLASGNYNPDSDVTSVKRNYPICLPAYLGTSANNDDHCALLRSIYGNGESGWLKFMESCTPVIPTDWGNMGLGVKEAEEWSSILASATYTSLNKTNEPMCKAANYCYNVEYTNMPKGTFRLPTTQEVYEILDGVQYNVVNDRTADVLNRALYKIGGSAVSCSSGIWSAYRLSASGAWVALGSLGFFRGISMYVSYVAIPVSLLKLV